MIRFRNPVSDINIVISVFKKLYVEFSGVDYFDLDNFAEFLARENLASSSGYTGNEALRRSYSIPDDSRKSMKMQAKSYTELYRFLGWIYSDSDAALKFSFTYIGMHVALSGESAKNLFEQNLLGVEYQNDILAVKFPDINKPFVNMLLFADELDGYICRDEILLGPMNLSDARSIKEHTSKKNYILELRKKASIKELNSAIALLSKENLMQPNSVRNLTRFVISSLVFVGWFKKENKKIYGNTTPFLVLTEKGKNVVKEIKESLVLYGTDIKKLDIDEKDISWLSILSMFKRADFNVDADWKECEQTRSSLKKKTGNESIIFSPFQYYSKSKLNSMFPNLILSNEEQRIIGSNIQAASEESDGINIGNIQNTVTKRNVHTEIEELLNNVLNEFNGDIPKSMNKIVSAMPSMKQNVFYPMVAALLGVIFDRKAFAPPAGNNNLRFDVIIPDESLTVPVEVKSPTEEEMLSVKAVRQALENKIVMLSRRPYETNEQMCSLAVGFKIPNKRSDVHKLIEDIYNTYRLNIAIMEINTIVEAALKCTRDNIHFDLEELNDKRGIMRFRYENI